jgi:hypothetical protein
LAVDGIGQGPDRLVAEVVGPGRGRRRATASEWVEDEAAGNAAAASGEE